VAVDGVSHDAHECDAKRLLILILSKCRVFFLYIIWDVRISLRVPQPISRPIEHSASPIDI